MESPSAQEGLLVVAQDDSSSVDQRDLSTSLPESTLAGQPHPHIQHLQSTETVPNVHNKLMIEEKTMDEETAVKFNEPNFTYLELSSRLNREESNDSTKCSDVSETLGCALKTMEKEQIPDRMQFDPRQIDSSTRSFADNKALKEINYRMYDENLFSDEVLESSSSESTPSRRRQTPDFLPINAEIKRIGVEISEEQAKQLKNDVRRLSPVLVSLRERTLGEISLTSDSGLFDESNQALRLEITEPFIELSNVSEQVSLPIAPDGYSEITSTNQEMPLSGKDQCENSASSHMENVLGSSLVGEKVTKSLTKNDQCPGQGLREIEQSECPNTPITENDFDASSTQRQRSNVQRELMIVLSRVDHESPETSTKTKITIAGQTISDDKSSRCENDSYEAARDKMIDNAINVPSSALVNDDTENVETKVLKNCRVMESCDEIVNENEERQLVENVSGKIDRTIMSSKSPVLVDDMCLSPKYRDNDQLRRHSPKVMLERTLKDSASPQENADQKIEHDRDNLDCIRRTLADSLDDQEIEEDDVLSGDPLAINEDSSTRSDRVNNVAVNLQESLDTETETETASDNSEIVSLISIQSRDCVESTNDGSTCPETDSVVSDETPRDMMTRLEPEGPEAFTEDSAESLALTTGARDEVRSDGSDSGLGSEIPGDPGIVPAPESDSETSFLDRIPDDILSDKDKAVNPLEAFAADPGTSAIQQEHQENLQAPQLPLPSFPNPPKSSLKRRLTDCMEGEPSAKRINIDDPMKKKRNIQFDAVTVYYFPRAQGFTCVPSQGGSTLGMSATHTHAERFSLTEHAAEQRRLHRARLTQLRSERAANCVTEAASSSEDPSDDTDEEPSDTEELDIDSYYFLQPVPTWQRRALLRAAGVRRIDAIEKDDCRDIRASREHCGCGCKGYCDPESCPCSRANVKCQVDRAGFPCGCSRDGCANTSGRIEFNPVRVRTHFIHTLMRLQLEKKQRDEDCTEHDLMMNNQIDRGLMREVPSVMGDCLGAIEHSNPMIGDSVSCMNTGGFTTLHYETHDPTTASCPTGVVHAAREDSLDLYAIRDDCYSADDTDGGPISQRKLHPEFGQVFQAFPGQQPAVTFPQSAYQDYQSYQALASTSRSQFQPTFQNVTTASPAFNHYSYGHGASVMQPSCQSHQTVSAHHSVYETTGYSQEDAAGANQQQYTNLNSVQPMNTVVQQIGKLEPFSELLASRYSYYGDPEPQPIPVSYHANTGQKIESDKSQIAEQHPVETNTEDCDENFGEIIKKSMVETVSA